MTHPKISIAMTTYNGGRFLREQLDSILQQTLTDIEVVICDDCSSDDTWAILTEYAAHDPRIHIYLNEHNLGFKKNFEKAISLCQGEYIAMSDQDDRWLPNHLDILLQALGDKALACGNVQLMNAQGEPYNFTLNQQSHLEGVPDDDLLKAYRLLFYINAYQGASMLFRADLRKYALPVPEGEKNLDEWFATLACFCGGLSHTYDLVGFYRIHEHNAVGVSSKPKHLRRLRMLIRPAWPKSMPTCGHLSARAILERVPNLTPEQTQLLRRAITFNEGRYSWWGRVREIPFVLKHYKYIFSCAPGHWL